MKRLAILGLAVFLVMGLAAYASATTYSFYNVTNNNAGDVAIGLSQLTVDVTDNGDGTVSFTFNNSGPAASSITDVYFDDGSLLAIASITNGSGVSFSQYATPPNLPGGQNATPPFVTTAGFSADSDTPVQPMGVNPGETLTITFTLQDGQTYDDVIADLNDGSLRIGIHVQGFASGGSEAFVNNAVPEPGTILLLGAGLVGVGLMRRRFKK